MVRYAARSPLTVPARRWAVWLGLLLGMALSGTPLLAQQRSSLRIMASNLTSGNNSKYEGPGSRILQGLDADVVLMQEFNYLSNTPEDLDDFVATNFGAEFRWVREEDSSIPNGVISRYPIKASGEWDDTYVDNRDFAWAQIDIPGARDLWVVSVHFLTSSSSTRNSEAKLLVSYIKEQGIPADDYLVIGGDLNTGSRTESCITTLAQVVRTDEPYPADHDGNSNTNSGRSKPYDWLLVDADLEDIQQPTWIGASVFTYGLVFDSRVYSPLSEVPPVQEGDSGASGMQHMGVVKDFAIPAEPEEPTPSPTPPPTAPPTEAPTAPETPSPTATPTATPTPAPTEEAPATPDPTPEATPSPPLGQTEPPTPEPTPTSTASPTPTSTEGGSPTDGGTPTPTAPTAETQGEDPTEAPTPGGSSFPPGTPAVASPTPDGDAEGDTEGCGCTSTTPAGAGSGALLLWVGLALRRRRTA